MCSSIHRSSDRMKNAYFQLGSHNPRIDIVSSRGEFDIFMRNEVVFGCTKIKYGKSHVPGE